MAFNGVLTLLCLTLLVLSAVDARRKPCTGKRCKPTSKPKPKPNPTTTTTTTTTAPTTTVPTTTTAPTNPSLPGEPERIQKQDGCEFAGEMKQYLNYNNGQEGCFIAYCWTESNTLKRIVEKKPCSSQQTKPKDPFEDIVKEVMTNIMTGQGQGTGGSGGVLGGLLGGATGGLPGMGGGLPGMGGGLPGMGGGLPGMGGGQPGGFWPGMGGTGSGFPGMGGTPGMVGFTNETEFLMCLAAALPAKAPGGQPSPDNDQIDVAHLAAAIDCMIPAAKLPKMVECMGIEDIGEDSLGDYFKKQEKEVQEQLLEDLDRCFNEPGAKNIYF